MSQVFLKIHLCKVMLDVRYWILDKKVAPHMLSNGAGEGQEQFAVTVNSPQMKKKKNSRQSIVHG